jgi:hypothetical protein
MATAEQRNHARSFLKKAEEYLASAEANIASTSKGKDHATAAKELRQALARRAGRHGRESAAGAGHGQGRGRVRHRCRHRSQGRATRPPSPNTDRPRHRDRAPRPMTDLADAVLPLIRTRADLYRWSASNARGRQMHEAVHLLEQAVTIQDPAIVFSLRHNALASATKVIARADDSSGIIGDDLLTRTRLRCIRCWSTQGYSNSATHRNHRTTFPQVITAGFAGWS